MGCIVQTKKGVLWLAPSVRVLLFVIFEHMGPPPMGGQVLLHYYTVTQVTLLHCYIVYKIIVCKASFKKAAYKNVTAAKSNKINISCPRA